MGKLYLQNVALRAVNKQLRDELEALRRAGATPATRESKSTVASSETTISAELRTNVKKPKVSHHVTKMLRAVAKLKRLETKREAACDKHGIESRPVAKLNMLIAKASREVASLKMRQYNERHSGDSHPPPQRAAISAW